MPSQRFLKVSKYLHLHIEMTLDIWDNQGRKHCCLSIYIPPVSSVASHNDDPTIIIVGQWMQPRNQSPN